MGWGWGRGCVRRLPHQEARQERALGFYPDSFRGRGVGQKAAGDGAWVGVDISPLPGAPLPLLSCPCHVTGSY